MTMKHYYFQFVLACWLCLRTLAVHADMTTDYNQLKSQIGEHSLPLINLVVDLGKVTKPVYTIASMEVCDPLRRMDGNVFTPFRCKVKYRGNSSMRYEKKSFTIKLLDTYNGEFDVNLLGLRTDDTWVLDAMAIDRIRMRNRVNFDVWNDMSRVPYQTDFNSWPFRRAFCQWPVSRFVLSYRQGQPQVAGTRENESERARRLDH